MNDRFLNVGRFEKINFMLKLFANWVSDPMWSLLPCQTANGDQFQIINVSSRHTVHIYESPMSEMDRNAGRKSLTLSVTLILDKILHCIILGFGSLVDYTRLEELQHGSEQIR